MQKVIDVTRKEVIRLIKEQKQGVFQRLLQTPDFFQGQQDQQRNLSGENIQQWTEILKGEAYKAERLEVAFAVVGTMKAGKSTTINAIVGTEILPNRNQPMTTLPTIIRHCPGKKEPELTFANPKPFNELLENLHDKLKMVEKLDQLDKLAFCATEDGKELVKIILSGSLREIRQSYKGHEEIFGFLKGVNDIWRLCNTEDIMLDVNKYLAQYTEIQHFPAIEVEFSHLRDQDHTKNLGSIALIDTPGPNEAGQTFLKHIMKEQLEKASAVLAVLDYTQLNAEADAEIRKSLEEISNVTGNRLFVLVNKYDQKDRHGMENETLRSYVAKQLFEGRLTQEHVFPVSSKYSYLANRALNELNMNGRLPNYKLNPWVEDFGQLALGACWESEIEDAAEVKNRATKLWKTSLFDQPLTEIIKKGCENAAIMSLKSAIAKMLDYDKKIIENIQFRLNALNTDIKVIEDNILSLEKNVSLIKDANEDVRQVIDYNAKLLQQKIGQAFDESEEHITREIQRLYGYQDDSRFVTFDINGYNDFASEEEARKFMVKIFDVVDNTLKEMQLFIAETFNDMANNVWAEVTSRLETVLKSAEQQLREAFASTLDFPELIAFEVNFDKLRQNSIVEGAITKVDTKYERKWYTLWFHEHKVKYQYKEQVHRIYIRDVIMQLQQRLEEDSNGIWSSLDEYVRNKFRTAINVNFAAAADYLQRFKGDLICAQSDKELESKRIENLQSAMNELMKIAAAHRKEVQVLGEGLPDKTISEMEKVAG